MFLPYLSGRELAEWRAYLAVEPVGWDASNISQAMIRWTLTRLLGGEDARDLAPSDFVLGPRESLEGAEEATPDMLRDLLG